MPAPMTAWVPRKAVTRNTGTYSPHHVEEVHAPMPDIGDPFAQPVVRYGEFFTQGKARSDPGVHLNYYTAIPELQSIMERFWGFVMPKLRYRPGREAVGRTGGIPRGRMRALGQDVNVDRPGAITVGDLATFTGHNRDRIRTSMRG